MVGGENPMAAFPCVQSVAFCLTIFSVQVAVHCGPDKSPFQVPSHGKVFGLRRLCVINLNFFQPKTSTANRDHERTGLCHADYGVLLKMAKAVKTKAECAKEQ